MKKNSCHTHAAPEAAHVRDAQLRKQRPGVASKRIGRQARLCDAENGDLGAANGIRHMGRMGKSKDMRVAASGKRLSKLLNTSLCNCARRNPTHCFKNAANVWNKMRHAI